MDTSRAEDVRRVVDNMARALDAGDFGAARAFLAPDCVYETGAETLRGLDAILASYAGASAWARRTLDEVRYESAVAWVSEAAACVTFTDYLLAAGRRWHRYRCRQEFTVGANGRIVRIVHREMPGEREALGAYFRECGIER